MAQNPPRIVRRGNTSGLIGLWNGKSQHENSSNVTADSLKIRQEANRRTSARDPPKLEDLEQFRTTLRAAPTSSAAGAMASGRIRKTSEIVRPGFKIEEEQEGTGRFASSLMDQKPSFTFHVEVNDDDDQHDQEDQDNEDEILNRQLDKVKYHEGRRGSKTTDDLEQFVNELHRRVDDEGSASESSGRRGSLLRSKSVKEVRVKFGLIMDATDGKGNEASIQ